jgi:hypothetical protein
MLALLRFFLEKQNLTCICIFVQSPTMAFLWPEHVAYRNGKRLHNKDSCVLQQFYQLIVSYLSRGGDMYES